MVLLHDNIVGLDSAIFMHPTIWKASGHVDAFNDPLIDNKDSRKGIVPMSLSKSILLKLKIKSPKKFIRQKRDSAMPLMKRKFRETNPRVLANQTKLDEIHSRFKKALNETNLVELRQIIIDNE